MLVLAFLYNVHRTTVKKVCCFESLPFGSDAVELRHTGAAPSQTTILNPTPDGPFIYGAQDLGLTTSGIGLRVQEVRNLGLPPCPSSSASSASQEQPNPESLHFKL